MRCSLPEERQRMLVGKSRENFPGGIRMAAKKKAKKKKH